MTLENRCTRVITTSSWCSPRVTTDVFFCHPKENDRRRVSKRAYPPPCKYGSSLFRCCRCRRVVTSVPTRLWRTLGTAYQRTTRAANSPVYFRHGRIVALTLKEILRFGGGGMYVLITGATGQGRGLLYYCIVRAPASVRQEEEGVLSFTTVMP